MTATKAQPYVFLSYSREDKPHVDRVYRRLKEEGLNPWMDVAPEPYPPYEHIPPGRPWDSHIREAILGSFRCIAFVSRASMEVGGHVLREFRLALSQMSHRPQNVEWLVPVAIDDVPTPTLRVDEVSLSDLNIVPLRIDDRTLDHLVQYLKGVWPSTTTVTPQQVVIIHSSWRAPRYDQQYGQRVYRFDVKIGGSPHVLGEIESVQWLLPPAWPNSPIETARREEAFGHRDLTWGDLVVRANVRIRRQEALLHLSGFVQLKEDGPRLLPHSGRRHEAAP